MKKTKLTIILAIITVIAACSATLVPGNLIHKKNKFTSDAALQEGDIIFQTNVSPQCLAIQLATGSKWSHVGIVLKENGKWVVLEAVQPVKMTPLRNFIERGEGDLYALKRLKNSGVLTQDVIQAMHDFGSEQVGKNYDEVFMWSDEEMYCSELVWKIYHETTGLEIGELRPLSDFDLTHPLVRAKLEERYGSEIPMDEIMISPGDIFESKLLFRIE